MPTTFDNVFVSGSLFEKKIDELNDNISVIAKVLGEDSTGTIKSHKMTQTYVRAGTISKYVATGELYKVDKESGVSVTVKGNITATVNEETFIAAVGHANTHGYEFIYDGAAWHMEGEETELAAYGIVVTGTPAAEDAIVVHVTGSEVVFEVAAPDGYDVPANSELTHALSLITRDVQSYNTIAFCPAQMLKVIAADEFSSGIAAGTTLYITLDHGCYDGTTKQDGTYNFTVPHAIPVGGGIRHSLMGVAESSASNYTKARILSGTFTTYDASGNVIDSGLATSEGATGTNLGTATAEDKQYQSGSHLNTTRRQAYGSNQALNSYIKMWLESDAKGAANGAVASWYKKLSEFDLPIKSTLPGWLHGFDPEFVSVICPVRKRTLLHTYDRETATKYVDAVMKVWQPSMTEVGLGQNDSVYEVGVDASGNTKVNGPYPLYNGASNSDRIKYEGTTARVWWLRSPYPSLSYHVRYVKADGSLSYYHAYHAYGAVAGLCIG